MVNTKYDAPKKIETRRKDKMPRRVDHEMSVGVKRQGITSWLYSMNYELLNTLYWVFNYTMWIEKSKNKLCKWAGLYVYCIVLSWPWYVFSFRYVNNNLKYPQNIPTAQYTLVTIRGRNSMLDTTFSGPIPSFTSTSALGLWIIHGNNVTNTSRNRNPARYAFSATSIMTKMSDLGYLW